MAKPRIMSRREYFWRQLLPEAWDDVRVVVEERPQALAKIVGG